ncbi:MAG: LD-carboxypeptidase [Bacteriovoracaceae bacterium]
MKIIYPKSNSEKHIGVTAPSSGLGNDVFNSRFNLVRDQHKENGFEVTEGECLREDNLSVNADSKARAEDFLRMWENPKISLIQPPWGGEFLIDILEHINFEELKD